MLSSTESNPAALSQKRLHKKPPRDTPDCRTAELVLLTDILEQKTHQNNNKSRQKIQQGQPRHTSSLSFLSAVATKEHLIFLIFKAQGSNASLLSTQLGKNTPQSSNVLQASINCCWEHLALLITNTASCKYNVTFQNGDLRFKI